MFKAFAKQHEDKLYVLFRIIVGLLFLQHGLQKIFGLLGGSVADPFTMMWFAGIIELVVGIAITLGLWTRIAALLGALLMLAAWFIAHRSFTQAPIETKGELALLFLAAFVVLFIYGNKTLSIEKLWN